MRAFVSDLSACDIDTVIDDVCTAIEVADYREKLGNHSLLVVKVGAPLDTLEHREKTRGNRLLGLAREQLGRIHEGIEYDLSIDTETFEPRECAKKILTRLGDATS